MDPRNISAPGGEIYIAVVSFGPRMTQVGLVDSMKYGGRLFGYFLGVALLGAGGMALGGVLAGPELTSWTAGDSPQLASLAGGIVIALAGFTIWFTGLFGLTYKLIADAAGAGVAGADSQETTGVTNEAGAGEGSAVAAEEPISGPATARSPPQSAPTGEESVPGRPGTTPQTQTATRTADTRPTAAGAAGSSGPGANPNGTTANGPAGDVPDGDPGTGSASVAAGDDTVADRTAASDADDSSAAGRERTAEEIAFGQSSGTEPAGKDKSTATTPTESAGDDEGATAERLSRDDGTAPESEAADVESDDETVRTTTTDTTSDDPLG